MSAKRGIKEERYILFDYYDEEDNADGRVPIVLDFTYSQIERFKREWLMNVPIGKIAAALGVSKENAKLIFIDLQLNGQLSDRIDGWEGYLNTKYKVFTGPNHSFIKTEFSDNQVDKFKELWEDGLPLKQIASQINVNYDSAYLLWMDLNTCNELEVRLGGIDGGQMRLF